MVMTRGGLPRAYGNLKTPDGRRQFREMLGVGEADPSQITANLLNLSLGRLRSTDPILGDLTVILSDARHAVFNRLIELDVISFDDPEEDGEAIEPSLHSKDRGDHGE